MHIVVLALLLQRTHLPSIAAPSAEVQMVSLPRARVLPNAIPPRSAARAMAPSFGIRRGLEAATPDTGSGAAGGEASPAGPVTPSATYGRLGPAPASGKLWVRPLPLAPRELAARLARTQAEMADSAVTAIIQAFLDSLAMDPAAQAARPPDWTTHIAGAKFGLDSKWIYVAGLKIPTALLALLPLPPGNEQKAFDRSGELYRDLRQAAQRAANLEEFKKTIKEIRERTEAERQFKKNQRTPPPPDLTPQDQPQ